MSCLYYSTQHLWHVLRRIGFRLKRSLSTPRSGTAKPTARRRPEIFVATLRAIAPEKLFFWTKVAFRRR